MASTIRCAGCGTPSDGAFCQECGTPLDRRVSRAKDRRAWLVTWILAAGAIAAVVAGVVRGAPEPVVPAMASAGGRPVTLPDLGGLSPAERFATLFDRLMRAGAERDSATVASLSPLAVEAYARLDSVDADARFHAGLIAIQIGNFPGAHALADTLEARDPGHLFGPILVGALARLEGDTTAYRQALVAFRSRADTELARTDRPEYVEHQQLLAEVRQAAETQ